MPSKTNIVILGLGAVGGYYGGKLASYYLKENRIIFFARGENEKAIRMNGLKLISDEEEQIIHPSILTNNAADVGPVDLIIICVKSFDLEKSLESIKPCIDNKTIILPLLNGIDAPERIKIIIPETEVWDGCVYLVSRLIAPGVVKVSGAINHLYFGSRNASKEKLKQVENIFTSANIKATLSENITETVWEKFLFISPLATATSYFNISVGSILKNNENKEILLKLISELKNVAAANDIILPQDIIEKTINKITSLPFETTTSMHSDFQKGNKTEVDSLTGYVTRLGRKLNIATPMYDTLLNALKEKIK